MEDIVKIDNELYEALYGKPQRGNYWEVWEKIKNNPNILREAIQVIKNNNKDTLKGLTIAETMLINHKSIDKDIYQELINIIFRNIDIAKSYRKNLNISSKLTFIEIALSNKELLLTSEQKAFACEEVSNNLREDEYNPFDIRYLILTNSNWNDEEKIKLALEFYSDSQYKEYIDAWESNIINNIHNFKGQSCSLLNIDNLYEYTYDYLLNIYQDKRITEVIWKKIEFCRFMHKIKTNEKIRKLK